VVRKTEFPDRVPLTRVYGVRKTEFLDRVPVTRLIPEFDRNSLVSPRIPGSVQLSAFSTDGFQLGS